MTSLQKAEISESDHTILAAVFGIKTVQYVLRNLTKIESGWPTESKF